MSLYSILSAFVDVLGVVGFVLLSFLSFYFLGFWDALTVVAVVAFFGLTLWVTGEDTKLKAQIEDINRNIKRQQDKIDKIAKAE